MMKFKKPYAFLVAGLLTLSIGVSTLFNNTAEIESVKAASGDTYTLVNSTDQLEIGATYIFLSIDNNVAMSSQDDDIRSRLAYDSSLYDTSSKTFTAPGTGTVSEFELSGTEGNYKFMDLESNLYLTLTSDGNKLYSNPEDEKGWSITFSGDDAVVSPNGYSRSIRYNSSSPRFACYKSGQQPINLFKKSAASSTDVLESLECVGTPVTQYNGQPFNPEGLTFYGTYSESGEKEVNSSLLAFDPEVMTLGTTSVKASIGDVSVVINNIEVIEDPKVYFGQHEEFSTWPSGYNDHTLDYESFSVEFQGFSKQSGTITNMPVSKAGSVIITLNNSISATHEITYVEFGFVQWTTKAQTIKLDDQTLSINSNTDDLTISKTYSNHTTSVTAQATNSSNQVGWEYVIVTIEELEITPLMEAETFAQSVIGDLICDPNGVTAPSTDEWLALANKYETLSEEAKALFVDTTESSVIKDALAKYDYILGKYGSEAYANFMNREVVSAANNITNPILNTTNNIIIIVSVCVLAISAIGVFIVISKKRKEIKK